MGDIYVPLHVHTHHSILDGFATGHENADRAKAIGAPAVAMTDHGSCSGHWEHTLACRRNAIKPIYGIETYLVREGGDPVAAAMAWSEGRGVDGVLIAASTDSSEPVTQAAAMARTRGRIVLLGVTGLELDRAPFFAKELSFQVSCSYGPGRYDPAAACVRRGDHRRSCRGPCGARHQPSARPAAYAASDAGACLAGPAGEQTAWGGASRR